MDRALVGLTLTGIFAGTLSVAYVMHWAASRITIVRKGTK